MTQYTFSPKDFEVFDVDGLDARMEALDKHVRPQLHQLGDYFAEYLTSQTGETFYAHVAKHARRSVNPPIDTWVAFAPNKRGYKMLPHFQIGLFRDQLFLMYGVMHEGKDKAERVKVFDKHFDELRNLPKDYRVNLDHMKAEKPFIKDFSDDELHQAIDRVKNVKKGEFFVARVLEPTDQHLKTDKDFLSFIKETFDEFLKFY
ncbi:DUF1054 domain-containing protein [Staphylococcus sp. NRL 16/872]|uniref:YktB family protein n=1 Tax=Staphylococcus sp. NRL 16/872 TaxID=2930131 RepID=UPI001FB2532B|nr:MULTISPECIES: DUF1054 domain-containing protein [unclassified Staphylococcus]MCJ1656618.1 DUF1054 domain-containing protein [Staphylococcus sp. NRL 21/187]MCJ1662369.1 DUF1054 domain-containing protein [Staphylococcus sp. NRL 18/288]MCJ1668456.1 DUF1054 domain-containing protein [Staphylococcus sp. NRL 19/737]WEN68670.1 DUF1054 domain-containing protein [Staphylococcus sp. NRL 16/872]